jgi:hypothetical protein
MSHFFSSAIPSVWRANHFFVIDGRTGQRILPAEARVEAEAEARRQAETRLVAMEARLRELEAQYRTQKNEEE